MSFFVIMCHNVFNVWPKTTLLLPVWPRDAKRLDTPALDGLLYDPTLIFGLRQLKVGCSPYHVFNQCLRLFGHGL